MYRNTDYVGCFENGRICAASRLAALASCVDGAVTKNKTRFGAVPLRQFPPLLWLCVIPTLVCHSYSEFCPNQFMCGRIIAENPLSAVKVNAVCTSSLQSYVVVM